MSDYRLDAYCDHGILDYRLVIDGISPNYTSDLVYPSNGDPTTMIVREFTATEGMTNFQFNRDGISNFTLSGVDTIIWNTMGFLPNVSYVEGLTTVYPNRIYLASYTTTTPYCPMCLGRNTRHDISFDRSGSIDMISGNDKLAQELSKIILTELQSNRLHDEYGTDIPRYIGQNVDNLIEFQIQQSVQNAIAFLINQQAQSQVAIPPEETIARMSGLSIGRDSSDPRLMRATISVTTAVLEEVVVTLTLPNIV